jgi:epoxyqueuosine reductase QueG
LKRLWQFRNNIYHQDNEGTIAKYKIEALERDMEKLRARHIELLLKLWDFQKQHFDRRQHIVTLRYESKKCWATLAKLYLDDAENNRDGGHSDIDQTNGLRTGVG